MTPSEALRLIEIEIATLLVLDARGRILRQGEPDGSPGPRLSLASCVGGALVRFGLAVGEEAAARIEVLAAVQPPRIDPDAPHPHLDEIAGLLSREAPIMSVTPGVAFRLPNGLDYAHQARIVAGGTVEGRALLARLERGPWPASLRDAGFRDAADFWDPWVVALEGDEIAAMAFAARLGAAGAEIGVYTFAPFRGRGLAAAVTAAWSRLASLESRALFYSTQTTNRSSRRVAQRLGLERIGVSLGIA